MAPTAHERLLMVQVYMAVTAISMLTLAAALAERRAAIGVRDEFISIASHELKTPLTALKLRLGSAMRIHSEQAPATSPNEEKLTRALVGANTTDRLVSLVDDLLDVSRLTAGRLVLRLEAVELASWCATSWAGCARTRRRPARTIEVRFRSPSSAAGIAPASNRS